MYFVYFLSSEAANVFANEFDVEQNYGDYVLIAYKLDREILEQFHAVDMEELPSLSEALAQQWAEGDCELY